MGKLKDETGNKYGTLTVTSRAPNNKHEQTMWNCLCDCGNTSIVEGGNLRNGRPKSCRACNETGNRYGKLTVTNQAPTNKHRQAMWNCLCDCGNTSVVSGNNLHRGYTKSCGCVKSYAELYIGKLLRKYNTKYKREYTFPDLKSDKGYPLRFDFAVFKNNKLSHLIEYDGEQHHTKDNNWYTEDLVENDKRKNKYCKLNSVKLRRLSGAFKDITKEQLN